jgi:hypothetical protein
VVVPELGEIEQPEASRRVAEVAVGSGVGAEPPHQGQVVVKAATAGVLRIRGDAVAEINRRGAVLLATSLEGRVVRPDETVAVIKAASLWTSLAEVDLARRLIGSEPLLRVAPFRVTRAAFLAGSRVRLANVNLATESLGRTLERYGARVVDARQVADDATAIAANYHELIESGAQIILIGGSIVLDPGDPFIVAAESIGGELTCRGAPIDPGTMFWVAYVGSTAILGLASCEMYGRLSVLDLALPFVLAGERVDRDLLATLGYGGLLEQTYSALALTDSVAPEAGG